MAVIGTRGFASFYNGLLTLDATNADTLRQRSFFATGGFAENVVVKDTIAYIASGYSGLWLVSIADARRPKEISNIITGGYTCDVTVTDTVACIVNSDLGGSVPDSARGLWTISVSDPGIPIALAHSIGIVKYTGTIPYNSISTEGNLVLICQQNRVGIDSILEIIDISNPRQPIRVGGLRAGYSPYHIAVEDSIAYLATPDSGLRIIDFHNPEAPRELSHILSSALGIAVRSPYAYVMRESLFVVDVTNLHSPQVVGSTFTRVGNTDFRVAVSQNYVYWVYGEMGVVDVSNPVFPVQMVRFFGHSFPSGVSTQASTVFVTEGTQGMLILRNNLLTTVEIANEITPTGMELLQNYPNPFNPTTQIGFSIAEKGRASLNVFNILGQKVATLFDGVAESGHLIRIHFDASQLASGVYLYKLQSGSKGIVRRMIVLK
jgi:hypothetical protein